MLCVIVCSISSSSGMETYQMRAIEDGLKKERDLRIERTIENVGTIPDELFMRNHLDGLNANGKGRFS